MSPRRNGFLAGVWKRTVNTDGRRGVAVILGGTALGQLVIGLSSPILSRIFSPSAFGLLAVFTAIVSIGAIANGARLEMAVPTAPSDDSARRIVRAALSLCFLSSLIECLVLIPLAPAIADSLGVPSLEHWLWLAPWGCGFAAAFVVLNQWAVRVGSFGAIGRRNALRSIFTAGTQIGTGLAGIQPGGTVIGLLAGHAVGALSMMRGAFGPRDIARGLGELWQVVRERWRFCGALTISGLFNVAGIQVPVLIFAVAFSEEAVGWLGFTQRVLALPVALVGTAIMQVYVSYLATAIREGGDARGLYLRLSRRLSLIAVAGAVVLAVTGPDLFRLVFGDEWETAGLYARYLSLGIGAQLIAVPLSQTMILVGRTSLQLAWDLGRFVVVCAAVGAAPLAGFSAGTVVTVYGGALFLSYAAQWLMNYRALHGTSDLDDVVAGPPGA